MSIKITGNFYGQDYQLAEREAEELSAQNKNLIYEVETNMDAGGYQIVIFRECDGECLGYYDDGDKWLNGYFKSQRKAK